MRPSSFEKLAVSLDNIPNPPTYTLSFQNSPVSINLKTNENFEHTDLESQFTFPNGSITYSSNTNNNQTLKISPNLSSINSKFNLYPITGLFDFSFNNKICSHFDIEGSYNSKTNTFKSTFTPKFEINFLKLKSIIECQRSGKSFDLWIRTLIDSKHLSFRTSIKPFLHELRLGLFSTFKPFSIGSVTIFNNHKFSELKVFIKTKIGKTRLSLTNNISNKKDIRIQLRSEKRIKFNNDSKLNLYSLIEKNYVDHKFIKNFSSIGFDFQNNNFESKFAITSQGIIYAETIQKIKNSKINLGIRFDKNESKKSISSRLFFGLKF